MTSPNPPWAREASNLAASCEEVERGGSRKEELDKPKHEVRLREMEGNPPFLLLLTPTFNSLLPLIEMN